MVSPFLSFLSFWASGLAADVLLLVLSFKRGDEQKGSGFMHANVMEGTLEC